LVIKAHLAENDPIHLKQQKPLMLSLIIHIISAKQALKPDKSQCLNNKIWLNPGVLVHNLRKSFNSKINISRPGKWGCL